MNHDDPKLTAHALYELDPAERAEIEAMLRDDPAAVADLDSTREFTTMLRTRLKSEPAPGLEPMRRAELLQMSTAARRQVVIVLSRKAVAWGALAASVVVGASLALLLPLLSRLQTRDSFGPPRSSRTLVKDGSQVQVGLAPEPALEPVAAVRAPDYDFASGGLETSVLAPSQRVARRDDAARLRIDGWRFSMRGESFFSNPALFACPPSAPMIFAISADDFLPAIPTAAAPMKAARPASRK